MAMPTDVGAIDLMMGIPEGSKKDWYRFLRAGFMDDESGEMEFPVQYMFKEVPTDLDDDVDPVAATLGEMDHFGIEKAMLGDQLRAEHLDPGHRGAPRPVLRLATRSTRTRACRASATS